MLYAVYGARIVDGDKILYANVGITGDHRGLYGHNGRKGRLQDSDYRRKAAGGKWLEIGTWPGDFDEQIERKVHSLLEKRGFKKDPHSTGNTEEFGFNLTADEIRSEVGRALNVALGFADRPNSYSMRPEQQECHDKIVKCFATHHKEVLMACVMRFGKCFTSLQVAKTSELKTVLIVTNRPETCDSWRDESNNHRDFADYTFCDLRDGYTLDTLPVGKKIIFVSFQYLNSHAEGVDKTWIYDIPVDAVYVDEEHNGSKTELSTGILNKFPDAKKIFMSGTPFKSWMSGRFTDENSFFWTYYDTQTRSSNPGPKMKTFVMDVAPEVARASKAGGFIEDDAFHIGKFFAADNGRFVYESDVRELVEKVFAPPMSKDRRRTSPLRIQGLNSKNFDHFVIRMPNSVASAEAMYSMLADLLPDYHVILAAGNGVNATTHAQAVKNTIAAYDKTITITCGRFETGVTVPQWGAIFLFDGGRSPEAYYQMCFRASTPADYKSEFYVFDFDPHRTLEVSYVVNTMRRKEGRNTDTTIAEWLEVGPILHHDGSRFVEIDAGAIIEHWNNSASNDMTAKFASEWGITERYDAVSLAALIDIKPTVARKIQAIIADNPELEKGKLKRRINKSLSTSEKREFNKTKEKLKTVLRRIPLAVVILGATDVDDLLTKGNANKRIFRECVGVDVSEYEHFIQTNLVSSEWQNNCIISVNNFRSSIDSSALKTSDALWKILALYANVGKEISPGTPRALAEEMLSTWPSSIWSDPNKKFLDPCFANGTFIFALIDKLMVGLSSEFPDEKERLAHILGNQVYGFEYNEIPFRLVKVALEMQYGISALDIKTNLSYNSILNEELSMKFEHVVMNPPYQAPQEAKGKRGGGDLLWPKFVEKAINEWTTEGGMVLSVNPSGWRKPDSKRSKYTGMFKMMTHENHMTHLEINDAQQGMKT
ncbi:MAG: DEAD/DEAH box helicase family protein, partial [Candidatus Thorarchaeota archaeon]